MLDYLHLKNVGPAPELRFEPAERLSLITGDNGLGKSFLLDVTWWALTRTWSRRIVLPTTKQEASIEYVVHGKAGVAAPTISSFRRAEQRWPLDPGRPPMPGIVVYVRVDGGFSVWDPARNYGRNDPDRPRAYHFTSSKVWNGLSIDGRRVCEGLERDWVSWQEAEKPQFKALEKILRILSPKNEPLRPGKPRRVFLGEGWDRPTIQVSGQEIPVAFASAGVRRILALAYFLVWAWYEHRVAAELLGRSPEERFVILFDEPETHLHPRWQRTILPSVLTAIDALHAAGPTRAQIIVATHSPLVLASAEPLFSPETDELFHLNVVDSEVVLETGGWAIQGDVTEWLLSDVFGLEQARSIEAEQAIEAAEAFMRGEEKLARGFETKQRIHEKLQRLLPANDQFWPRWLIDGKAGELVSSKPRRKSARRAKSR